MIGNAWLSPGIIDLYASDYHHHHDDHNGDSYHRNYIMKSNLAVIRLLDMIVFEFSWIKRMLAEQSSPPSLNMKSPSQDLFVMQRL